MGDGGVKPEVTPRCRIFDPLEAEALPEGAVRVVAIPREAWRSFFERLVLERETGSYVPSTNQRVAFLYRLEELSPG